MLRSTARCDLGEVDLKAGLDFLQKHACHACLPALLDTLVQMRPWLTSSEPARELTTLTGGRGACRPQHPGTYL